MHYFDNLQKMQKYYGRLLEPVCNRWNLTRNELDVVLFLYNNPHLDRATDIVACRGISKSHVSISVAGLEKQGYLRKHSDPADRRTIHLVLTEAAIPAATAGKAAQQEMAQMLLTGLTDAETELLQQLGDKIRQNIENLEDI